ncbi:MAG TPA: hypothetical protein ENN73_04255, partial [Firmicutes bacterium]|nr:hypothetical protein [Bacillota bacterium]
VGEALYKTKYLDANIIDCYPDIYEFNLYGDPGLNHFGVDVTVLSVKTISPNSSPNTGTASISAITGTSFNTGAGVQLRRTGLTTIDATNITINDSNTLSCDFDITDKTVGYWDVVVTNPDSSYTILPEGFLVSNRKAAIFSIEPSTGFVSENEKEVTITGNYFFPGVQVALKRTGETPIPAQNIVLVNSTTINCKFNLKNKKIGKWSLSVQNQYSDATVKTNLFEIYINAPYITHLNPHVIQAKDNQEVKVHGFYFRMGCEVKFLKSGFAAVTPNSHYIYATSEYESDLICTVNFLNRETGYYDCRVTNNDMQSYTLKNALLVAYPDFENMRYFPNPSRGEPIVFMDLPHATIIKIYDCAGTLVETLYDYDQDSKIIWDIKRPNGTSIPSGVYIAYLKAKGCERVIKIAVVK